MCHDLPENSVLLVDGCHGIYVPQNFINRYEEAMTGASREDINIVASGPDHEHYWEAWDCIEQMATVTDQAGIRYNLYQDGDLWAVPVDSD